MILLPAAGHAIQEDEAARTADAILSFIARYRIGAPSGLPGVQKFGATGRPLGAAAPAPLKPMPSAGGGGGGGGGGGAAGGVPPGASWC